MQSVPDNQSTCCHSTGSSTQVPPHGHHFTHVQKAPGGSTALFNFSSSCSSIGHLSKLSLVMSNLCLHCDNKSLPQSVKFMPKTIYSFHKKRMQMSSAPCWILDLIKVDFTVALIYIAHNTFVKRLFILQCILWSYSSRCSLLGVLAGGGVTKKHPFIKLVLFPLFSCSYWVSWVLFLMSVAFIFAWCNGKCYMAIFTLTAQSVICPGT